MLGRIGADCRSREIVALSGSRTFDAGWYAAASSDIGHSGTVPCGHSAGHGWKAGRAPKSQLEPPPVA